MRNELILGLLSVGMTVIAQGASGGDGGVGGLQGAWAVVAGEKAGQKAPEKDARSMTVEIDGDRLTFSRGDRRETFKIVLDPSASPHRIDLTGDDGTSRKGIYEMAGDSLRLCLSGNDQRPSEFASAPGSKTALMVLERKSK